ncbi:MAG: hypothetical protein JOY54_17850 [Acidobacteriaceae bacterium]|nr:hypothetical protein [Acidobacteriaceae bacterium]
MSAVLEHHTEAAVKSHHDCKIPDLRCFMYRESSGSYLAECIDLNLIAQGKSPAKAQESLENAINGYLRVALSGDPTGLVPRPSPLSRRALYHWGRLVNTALQAIHKTRKGFKTFVLSSEQASSYC